MEYVKSAFASIKENRGRSFLTMLGIIIGIASVITILAIGNGMKSTVGGELNDMQTGGITIVLNGKKTDKHLTGAEVREIGEKIPEAYGASPSVTGFVDLSARHKISANASGGNENVIYSQNKEVVAGRFFNTEEAESGSAVAVLPQACAAMLFGSTRAVGKIFEMTVNGKSMEITVVGLIKSEEKEIEQAYRIANGTEVSSSYPTIYVPYTLLTQSFGSPGENITSFKIFPHPNEQDAASLRTRRVTESLLGLRGQDAVTVQSYASMLETFNKILNVVTLVVAFVAAISLLVGGIGVMNIMTVSVTERTREIGIRKSLGARTSSILLQFLIESALITLIGGFIGMIAGYSLTFIVSKFMSFPPKIRLEDVALVVAISSSIGLFFGIYPALRAAKMNPIEALRYE
ncbi:MAG: ABC transporter permease [Lachnospiraceae bacterium]|nr:ABC transporter permease [Lachnospiraceae bacterium]